MKEILRELASHLYDTYALIAFLFLALCVFITHYAAGLGNSWKGVTVFVILMVLLILIVALIGFNMYKYHMAEMFSELSYYKRKYNDELKRNRKLKKKP